MQAAKLLPMDHRLNGVEEEEEGHLLMRLVVEEGLFLAAVVAVVVPVPVAAMPFQVAVLVPMATEVEQQSIQTEVNKQMEAVPVAAGVRLETMAAMAAMVAVVVAAVVMLHQQAAIPVLVVPVETAMLLFIHGENNALSHY